MEGMAFCEETIDQLTRVPLVQDVQGMGGEDESEEWRMDLDAFRAGYVAPDSDQFHKGSRSVRDFYEQQNETIRSYIRAHEVLIENEALSPKRGRSKSREQSKAIHSAPNSDAIHLQNEEAHLEQVLFWSNVMNLLLFGMKIAAAIMSQSLAIMSSLIDSFVDLFTGFAISLARRIEQTPKNREPRFYPMGRTQLEPLAIIICSAVMATASLELCSEAIQRLVSGSISLDLDLASAIIMVC